jgi:hypothetical protein
VVIDAHEVESVVLTVAKGVALVFPASAPLVGALSALLGALDAAGVIPEATTAVNVEQVRAQAAGMAAAQASAVTSVKERKT